MSAVGAPRAARTGPPRGHVEARPATLWPAPGTARPSAAAAAAAAAAAWRSRSPPRLAHAGHGAAAVGAGAAQQMDLCSLEKGGRSFRHFSANAWDVYGTSTRLNT